MYTSIPEGIHEDQIRCLTLEKAIYCLVQRTRQIYMKIILVLKSICFEENKSGACLLSNWNGKEIIINELYADDCLIIDKEERIQRMIVEFKGNGINLKVKSSLTENLSCLVTEDKQFNQILILQSN
jgi:hypothetical protein